MTKNSSSMDDFVIDFDLLRRIRNSEDASIDNLAKIASLDKEKDFIHLEHDQFNWGNSVPDHYNFSQSVFSGKDEKLSEQELILFKLLVFSAFKKLGSETYETWLSSANIESIKRDSLSITVPSRFEANWIEKHYKNRISREVRKIFPCISKIRFIAKGE